MGTIMKIRSGALDRRGLSNVYAIPHGVSRGD